MALHAQGDSLGTSDKLAKVAAICQAVASIDTIALVALDGLG